MKVELITDEEAAQRRKDALARGCEVTYTPASPIACAPWERWDVNALLDAYKNVPEVVDAYEYAASKALNIPITEVTPAQRQQAKALSFGVRA